MIDTIRIKMYKWLLYTLVKLKGVWMWFWGLKFREKLLIAMAIFLIFGSFRSWLLMSIIKVVSWFA